MYLLIWEYLVAEAQRSAFEHAYGPQGEWVRLFASAPGYLGTELCRDEEFPRRYLSIDRWASAQAYLLFREERSVEYNALDLRCEELVEHEAFLGGFVRGNDG